MPKREHHKVALLGSSGVGKSSIALRFVRNIFLENNEATIGAAFLTMPITRNDREISLDIWDTAGQERYNSLAPMYYRGSSAAIIVYDITSIETFNQAKRWVREIQDSLSNCFIILVGNKIDLESCREVQNIAAKEYAETYGIRLLESSAKSHKNIQMIFNIVADHLPKPAQYNSPTTSIDQPEKNKKGCKCKN